MASGTLYFFCGKMGAGKSTRSKILASELNAVLLSEDEWLATLYPGQISSFNDYRQYSALLKPLIYAHVGNLLKIGTNVVMDFPANTVKQRKWFVELADSAAGISQLIYIKASDATCLQHIAKRRIEQPDRAEFDTESMFAEVTGYFQEPQEGEKLNIKVLEINS